MEKKLRSTLPSGNFIDVPKSHSKRMGRIRSRGNRSTELQLRLALVRRGLRGWELHPSDIYGCPDFYFRCLRVAIFVDGCFWHNCPRCGHIPSTRRDYWITKFERNKIRARNVRKCLGLAGIKVIRFWEHDLTTNLAKTVLTLQHTLRTTN